MDTRGGRHGGRSDRIASRRGRRRRGAAILEFALAIPLFLMALLSIVDFGFINLRHQRLTDATCYIARKAAVRGLLSTDPWGPDPVLELDRSISDISALPIDATDGAVISAMFLDRLTGIPAEDLSLKVEWIDGGNDVRKDHRVRVTAGVRCRTVLSFGLFDRTIQSVSLTPISH
jgi:hypothetical protein